MDSLEILKRMLSDNPPLSSRETETSVVCEWAGLSDEETKAFEKATLSEYAEGRPPTLPTIYRWTEFRWLERMKIDMSKLLHTDQEYLYSDDWDPTKQHQISTEILSDRERRGLRFVSVKTQVKQGVTTAVECLTTFVIRNVEMGE